MFIGEQQEDSGECSESSVSLCFENNQCVLVLVICHHTFSRCRPGNEISAPCVWAWTRQSLILSRESMALGSDRSCEGSQSAPVGLHAEKDEALTPDSTPQISNMVKPILTHVGSLGLAPHLPFDPFSPAKAVSVMTLRTSSSMALLLHSSSHEPRIPYWSARARKCFWLGTTKPIIYDSLLRSGRRGDGSQEARRVQLSSYSGPCVYVNKHPTKMGWWSMVFSTPGYTMGPDLR